MEYFTGTLLHRPLQLGENLAEYMMDYLTKTGLEGRGEELVQAYQKSGQAAVCGGWLVEGS